MNITIYFKRFITSFQIYFAFLVAPIEKIKRIEEQPTIQKAQSNGMQSPDSISEITDQLDETPVKSLKILAQICVNELEKCNKREMQCKSSTIQNNDSIYISSDSESDASSIRSSQRGVITGGARKPSCSDTGSGSSSESSSDSSSSDSDDSDDNDDSDDDDGDDDDDENEVKVLTKQKDKVKDKENVEEKAKVIEKSQENEKEKEKENEKEKEKENETEKEAKKENKTVERIKIKKPSMNSTETKKIKVVVQRIVDEWSSEPENDEESLLEVSKIVEENKIETENSIVTDEKALNAVYNPVALKDICRDVLQAHSMIIRYEVPSLRFLCEHTLASNGIEIPLICFVQEEPYEYMSTDQPISNEDEGVYLCLDSEFDETELANLFSGSANGLYESVEIETVATQECVSDKTSLIDQCVALQNILLSPPPEDNRPKAAVEVPSHETEYYMDPNAFHDSIQYEETVLPSENHIEDPAIKIAKLKKYLQKKYVHPLSYHRMFAINKLLRKYKVHHTSFCNRKSTVQQKFNKTITKMRLKSKQRCKPKKLATRRSARIADKVKQQHEFDWKMAKKSIKSTKNNNATNSDNNLKPESTENKRAGKMLNVNDFIQNSSKKKIMSEADKESITRVGHLIIFMKNLKE